MKILKRGYKRGADGYVVLEPTEDEDLWHLYNLIQVGDCIRMATSRKIVRVGSTTGVKNVEKKRLTLTLSIVSVDYFAEGDRLTISIRGKNVQENDYLPIGQFHTFMVEPNQKITVIKEYWSDFDCSLLRQISTEGADCEVAAIVMDEGMANICYIKNSMTLRKLKIQKNIAKKSSGEEIYTKSLKKFFEECYRGLCTLDFSKIKCLIIASPGTINQQFMKYTKEAIGDDKAMRKELDKFVLVKSSTGFIGSLNQALADPKIMERLKDTKAIREIKVLEKFYSTMKINLNKVAYGQRDVIECNNRNAIETLLISDKLFRTKDLNKRKFYNHLVQGIKKKGAEVFIFSSLHQSGEKLNNLTGIAAILRFEVELEEEFREEEEPKNEEEQENVKLNENLLKRYAEELGAEDEVDDDDDGGF